MFITMLVVTGLIVFVLVVLAYQAKLNKGVQDSLEEQNFRMVNLARKVGYYWNDEEVIPRGFKKYEH